MPFLLAVDPGTVQSGYVVVHEKEGEPGNNRGLIECGVVPNHHLLGKIVNSAWNHLAIEMIASQGMAVGKETFETVRWIGRFQQAWRHPEDVLLVYRQEVKLRICGSVRANDSNIRQALIDMSEPTGGGKVRQVGTSKQPGPLFGMNSHTWPALGVAIVAFDKLARPKRRRIDL